MRNCTVWNYVLVKVYECFVEGAKDGINVCVRIFLKQ